MKAAIFDIDGCLADVSGYRHHIIRNHPKFPGKVDFDTFHRLSKDAPVIFDQARDFWHFELDKNIRIIVITSRKQQWQELTIDWLVANDLIPDLLLMRNNNDKRHASEVKREYVEELTKNDFDIVYACDDDPKIVKVYQELGIPHVKLVPGWIE